MHRKLKKWLKQRFGKSSGGQGSQSHAGQGQQTQGAWDGQGQQQQHQSYGQPQQHQTYGQPQQSYGQPSQGYNQPYNQGQFNQGQQGQYSQAPMQPPSHQWNQADASDSSVNDLRNQAIREGDLMKQCFDRAHNAHERGDGAEAKQLSIEGHQHQANKDRLNTQAADLIYQEKNSTQAPGTIDLHGLYVQEAIHKCEQAIQDGQRSGLRELRVIVGKGNHSVQHVAKVKPAIEDLMGKYGLGAELDPHNSGVLIVHLDGSSGSRDAGRLTRDIAQTQEGDQDQCVIS